MVKYFSRYLIITAKLAVKTEPLKYLGKYMHICLILPCAEKKQSICDKIAFLYFTQILFRQNNSLNSREGVDF